MPDYNGHIPSDPHVDGSYAYEKEHGVTHMNVSSEFPDGWDGLSKVEARILLQLGEAPVREVNNAEYGQKDLNKRAEVLRHAESLINGDRADIYGPPEMSFGRIAELWNAMGFQIFPNGYDIARPVNATDVALALTQLKISRIISSPDHEDSWVDAAGYIGLGAEIELGKASEASERLEQIYKENLDAFKEFAEPTVDEPAKPGLTIHFIKSKHRKNLWRCSECETIVPRSQWEAHADFHNAEWAIVPN